MQYLGLLHVSGVDAKKLLQGQLTCNLDDITPAASRLGAHCNPQGRILSLFKVFLHADSYYLLMPATMLPLALQALKKYAVFYKVQLRDASACFNELRPTFQAELPAEGEENSWRIANINAGIPAIYPATSAKILPHEINLQRLNAISFDKGCYTGQEIIARMHYRGQLKKQMYRARVKTQLAPQPGTETEAGFIVDSYQETADTCQILLITNIQAKEKQQLFLDPAKIEALEFVSLPY